MDYDELPAIVTLEDALKEDAPLVHEKFAEPRSNPVYGGGATYFAHEKSNIFHHFRFEQGNVEKGLNAADYVFEDTFLFPGAQHYPMEPHIGLANFERDNVTVWCGIQVSYCTL